MTASPVGLRLLIDGETSRPLISDPEHRNSGFSELREAVFVVAAPQDPPIELLIDDEPLPPPESGNGETRWKWRPRFYAGEVRAELVDASGATRGRFRLEVSPDPNKLGEGRRIFGQMLNDILDFNPALLLGVEPARRSLGAVGETDDPLVQFERLRRRREALERALSAIFRNPASVLRPRRRFVPLREARRADLETLRSALRNPAALAAVTGRAAPNASAANTEPVFDTPAVERRLDSPANRAALAMLRALRRRSEALPPRLEELAGKRSSKTRTDLTARLPRWKEILGGMERRFRAAERRTPFSEVKRPEITAAGLNAIAGNPLYARFWRLGWEALRRGVHRLDPSDMLPLAPTWEIYERWCFVALAKQLSEWLPDLGWEDRGGTGSDHRRFVGCRGGAKLTLQSQATFVNPRGQPQSGGWSVSRERRPDILLRREQNGCLEDFLVLDAKYTAANLVEAVGDTAHTYQDGLRWGIKGERPSATVILAPNAGEVAHPGWLTDPEFVKEHRIGVVELRPGAKPPDWLRDFVTGGLAPDFTGHSIGAD